jgi:hypothetical protein
MSFIVEFLATPQEYLMLAQTPSGRYWQFRTSWIVFVALIRRVLSLRDFSGLRGLFFALISVSSDHFRAGATARNEHPEAVLAQIRRAQEEDPVALEVMLKRGRRQKTVGAWRRWLGDNSEK